MQRTFYRGAVAALLLGAAVPVTAAAQTMSLPNGFYAGIDAGVIVPQSIDFHVSGSSGGQSLTANGDLNFDAGAAAGIVLGYHISPYISVEGNFEYGGFDLDSLSGSATATGPTSGSASGTIGLQGRFDTYSGLFNAIWTPLGTASWHGFSPYIGAGVGFSHIEMSLTGGTISGSTFVTNVSDSETDFAANGIVGFDYAVTPQFSIGARYRLLYVNMGSDASGGGFTFSNGDFIGHMITANASWRF
jgi:opacity protein-like surface antigen